MNAEDLIDNTITNLKIIGMVQKNGRLCVRRGQLTLESDDYLQVLRRWVHKDSRTHALMHVRNTINNAVTLYKDISADKFDVQMKAWTLSQLAKELGSCQTGLLNLKTTYAEDSVMVANLDVVLNRLVAFISEQQQSIQQSTQQSQQHSRAADQAHPRESRGDLAVSAGKSQHGTTTTTADSSDAKYTKPQYGSTTR